MSRIRVDFYKVIGLPSEPQPNSFYFVENGEVAEMYVTDIDGVPRKAGNTEMIEALIVAGVAGKADSQDLVNHAETIATENTLGHVRVDGDTITADEDGVISAVGIDGGGVLSASALSVSLSGPYPKFITELELPVEAGVIYNVALQIRGKDTSLAIPDVYLVGDDTVEWTGNVLTEMRDMGSGDLSTVTVAARHSDVGVPSYDPVGYSLYSTGVIAVTMDGLLGVKLDWSGEPSDVYANGICLLVLTPVGTFEV